MSVDMEFKSLIQESTFNAGGLLNAKQANRFIDYQINDQVILSECDVRKMTTNEEEIDRLSFAGRQMRKHTKGQKGSSGSVTSDQRSISLTESKLWLELDLRTLKRMTVESDGNIKGRLLKHIMRLAAQQFGNDIEDLGLNGDTADASADVDFLSITDGWIKIAKNDAIVYDTNASADYMDMVFPNMVDSLPEKYRRDKSKLRFYVSDGIKQAYIRQIAGTNTSAALPYLTGEADPPYEGVPIKSVPKMPSGVIILTFPKNLTYGIDRTGIERGFDTRIVERVLDAVIYAPIGFQIANEDAFVLGYDVA